MGSSDSSIIPKHAACVVCDENHIRAQGTHLAARISPPARNCLTPHSASLMRIPIAREKRQAKRSGGGVVAEIFPGNGKLTSQDEEIRQLRRELAVARQERDFLKKATAFFAKESR